MTESGPTTAIERRRTTPDELLDAAEEVFAGHGVDGGSLRQIMRIAGANPAAVHYHFGSRHDLACAVLERHLRPLNERRLALLDSLEASAPTIHELLEALIRPDLEAVLATTERNPAGARLVGAIYLQPTHFVKAMVEEHFAPVAARYMSPMIHAIPDVDPATIAWRVRWAVFPMIGALLSDPEFSLTEDAIESTLQQLVTSAAGAVAAPSPEGDVS